MTSFQGAHPGGSTMLSLAAGRFMAPLALHAEEQAHHPEWSNVYNRVDVTLATHDADGVTELDVKLATFMDEAAGG